jgi:type I restriction enzyme, S subunit
MSWEEMLVNEVCDEIIDCVNKTAPKSDLTTPYKMIRTTNVRNGEIDLENVFNVEKEVYEKWIRRGKPLKDDVILTREAPVGEVGILRVDDTIFLGQRTMMYRANKSLITPHFLYYSLMSSFVQNQLHSYSSGSTVSHVRVPDAKSFLVKVPKLKTQRRIADILSAYDDLIQNNLKRIKLLEQAAKNIYKEWFVNLRFPGHENTPINEETGLPVGWMKLTVEEYTKVASRGPSLNYKIDEGFPVLNQSCIRNGEIELDKVRIAGKLKENKEHCYLQINDILINSMGQGTLGRVSKNNSINEKFIIHNCITFLRSKDEYSQTLLYHFISSKENYFISISQGSTGQTTLKLSLIKEMEINTPSPDLIKLFDNQVLPMWTQIGYLKNQNQKLKAGRDILLPRLMNRTIEV